MNDAELASRELVRLDAESPWPGLRSFNEHSQPFFFGRNEELQDLFERVLHQQLTVLFGQSGLGKTSLLQAALVPRLRRAGLLPVPMRLRLDVGADEIERQMLEAMRLALDEAGEGDIAHKCAAARNIWLPLHDPQFSLIDAEGSPLIQPVLIFDQFEEIFTVPASQRQRAVELQEALAALVENRMPEEVRSRMEGDDELSERLIYHAHPAKVLLSLREDFLHLLERWRRQLPAIMGNRMELRPLNGRQALEVVTAPGRLRPNNKPPIVADDVGAAVVRLAAGVTSDVPLDELDAAPPLLSLVCAQLNAERLEVGAETISLDQLERHRGHVLESFYAECFSDQPPALEQFVEERLVSDSGYRQAVTLDTAHAELHRGGLSEDAAIRAIEQLIARRLLTVDERGGVRRIELTHDVLAPVASSSREHRRERERAKQQTARDQKRWRRQRRLAMLVLAALIVLCALLLGIAYRARAEVAFRTLIDAANHDFESGNYAAALPKFTRATELKPAVDEGWFGRGDTLVRQAYTGGNRDTATLLQAIDSYQHALAIAKNKDQTTGQHFAGLTKLAQAYVGLGDACALGATPDFSQAKQFYAKARETDPGSPDAYVGLGNIQAEQGQLRAAMAEYRKALSLAQQRGTPDYGAEIGLGSVYLSLGHYQLAENAFNRAIGADPASRIARFRLAVALSLVNPADANADRLWQSLAESKPPRLAALSRMNLAYLSIQRAGAKLDDATLQDALGNLEAAYRLDRYAFSALRLGIGRALQHQPEQARALWNETATLSWGSDSLSQRIYAPLLRVLLDGPAAVPSLRDAVAPLAEEGAAGFLESVRRDADLLQRSGIAPASTAAVLDIVSRGANDARQHNQLGPDDGSL